MDELEREQFRKFELLDRNRDLEPAAEERDGLMRELWLERRRNEDLRAEMESMRENFRMQYGLLERGAHRVLVELGLTRRALQQSEEARKEVIAGG